MIFKNIHHKAWLELFFLCGLVFLFRLYATVPVENSGDSFVKWFETKRLFYGLEYSRLDHHTMRWSINFLTLLCQKIFGAKPSTYYLPSAFAATMAAFFIYRIGIILYGRPLGIMALLLFSLHPVIIQAGSQLFPGIFSMSYVLGSVYFLLVYQGKKKSYYLILSAIFLFLAYGAKLTNLFFLPGILIYLYWSTKKIGPILTYLTILLVGFILETIIIDGLLGNFSLLGRLALTSGHLNIMQTGLEGEKTLWGILTRWQMLPSYMYLHTMTGFFAAFYFVTQRKKYSKDSLLALSFLSFAFGISFGLCSLHPVHFLLPHMPRYLNITIPFTLLLTLSLAGKINEKKYIILTFLLLALPLPSALANLIHSPLHRQFYKINDFQKKVMMNLQRGYGYIFFNEKNARLYRAMFIDDDLSLGLHGKDVIKIYIIQPGRTSYNPTSFLYLLTLQQDKITQGIIRPYPHQYLLKIEDFKQQIFSLNPQWGILW